MNHARTHARTRAGPGPIHLIPASTRHESAPHPLLATPIFFICHSHARAHTHACATHSCFPSDIDKWRLTEMTTSLLMFNSDTTEDGEEGGEDRRTGGRGGRLRFGHTHTPARLRRARCCGEQQERWRAWMRRFLEELRSPERSDELPSAELLLPIRPGKTANAPKELILLMRY